MNVELIHKIHVRDQELTLGVESDSAHFLKVQVLEDLLLEGFHSSFVVNQDAP